MSDGITDAYKKISKGDFIEMETRRIEALERALTEARASLAEYKKNK